MQLKLVVLLFIPIIPGLFAGDYFINFEIYSDPEHPDSCVVPTSKHPLIIRSYKEQQHPDKCVVILCGKKGWALVYSCREETIPEGCRLSNRPTAKFPSCCDQDLNCTMPIN